jgi:hypothetical protein
LHGCCYLLGKELCQARSTGSAKQHNLGKRLQCRSYILPHQQQKQQKQESGFCRTGQQPQQADCRRHSVTCRNNNKLIAATAPHNSNNNNKLSVTTPPPTRTSCLPQNHQQEQAVCHYSKQKQQQTVFLRTRK